MKLNTYLEQRRGRTSEVARKIGKAAAFVSQMAAGDRTVAAHTAIDLERATDFEVRVWDTRPHDWHRIWPHLIGTDGAPDPTPSPSQQEAAA